MSDYFRQNHSLSSFISSESWMILSGIEKRIKDKIESLGTKLKNWDIKIYRGILTGYNDAFIIDGKRKEELIADDPKSAEIIRPLLRGRDIKRYSFEFADLYIITTFPSLNIDIDSFPAVKEHLLSFGYDRLKQTGDPGARKKTNNKWFETQDSIGYWEDFYKQKIVWKIIGDQMAFFIDSNNFIVNNACYILTGESLEYLLLFLNSKIIKWYSYLTNMNKTGVGDMQVGAQNLVLFPIPIFQADSDKEFISLFNEILKKKKDQQEISDLENIANKLVYRKYGLTQEEIDFIDF